MTWGSKIQVEDGRTTRTRLALLVLVLKIREQSQKLSAEMKLHNNG